MNRIDTDRQSDKSDRQTKRQTGANRHGWKDRQERETVAGHIWFF